MASSTTKVVTEDGTYIAASQRPDGTWRKPRRVKDGYTPQDEVPLYESKGKQFSKHQPQYPVGLDPALIRAAQERKERQLEAPAKKSPIPGLFIDETKTKKKKKPVPVTSLEEVNNALSKVNLNIDSKPTSASAKNTSKQASAKTKPAAKEAESTPADPAKRLKNLRKRLREIETIEQKIASGELKNLEKDQLDKVGRKKEVLNEIDMFERILTIE